MLANPAMPDRKAHLEEIFWQAYRDAQYAIRNITTLDMPEGLDDDERDMWWQGTCGGNEDRRQA